MDTFLHDNNQFVAIQNLATNRDYWVKLQEQELQKVVVHKQTNK